MKRILSLLFVAGCAALMAGCASGPKYSQYKASIPPLAQDKGRIYFYRNSALGAAIQPAVRLNDQAVGTASPGGFFYVDRTPGDYKVVTTTEVERTLSLNLETNQTRYVRLDVSMGFFVGHIYPVLVENTVGENQITDCHYSGPIASKQ
jgi:hypothetical protein